MSSINSTTITSDMASPCISTEATPTTSLSSQPKKSHTTPGIIQTPPATTPSRPAGFLDLPKELRDEIYSLCKPQEPPRILFPARYWPCDATQTVFRGLAHVSRQVRIEYLTSVLKESKLRLSFHEALFTSRSAEKWLAIFGETTLRLMKHVEFYHWCKDVNVFIGKGAVMRGRVKYPDHEWQEDSDGVPVAVSSHSDNAKAGLPTGMIDRIFGITRTAVNRPGEPCIHLADVKRIYAELRTAGFPALRWEQEEEAGAE